MTGHLITPGAKPHYCVPPDWVEIRCTKGTLGCDACEECICHACYDHEQCCCAPGDEVRRDALALPSHGEAYEMDKQHRAADGCTAEGRKRAQDKSIDLFMQRVRESPPQPAEPPAWWCGICAIDVRSGIWCHDCTAIMADHDGPPQPAEEKP